MSSEIRKLVEATERLRVEFFDAVDRDDPAAALEIGTERLLPFSEDLAAQDDNYLNPHGVTLRNLSGICEQLERPIGQFYFAQRSFHVAALVDARGLEFHPAQADIGAVTATIAADLIGPFGPDRGELTESDELLLLSAAALVPRSIDLMGQLDAFRWAIQLRLSATKLRMLSFRDLKIVDCESQAMIQLALLALGLDDQEVAVGEVKEALGLWVDQLGSASRYWSPGLLRTWTAAAEILDSLGHPEAATSIRRAIQQATARLYGAFLPSDLAGVIDVVEHYRAALATL